MKIKKVVSLSFFGIALFSPIISQAASSLNLTPYGGVDVGMQNFGFKSGYGDNLFAKQLPVGNLFIGIKFNDYFGIEGGYETTIDKKKETTIGAGDTILGNLIYAIDVKNISQFNRFRVYGLHLGLTGRYPIFSKEDHTGLSIVGYLGIKYTTVKSSRNIFKITPALGPTEAYNSRINLDTDNKKNLARLAFGLEYFFYNHVGLRTLIGWENTARLKPVNNGGGYMANLKNSYKYSIGIIFK